MTNVPSITKWLTIIGCGTEGYNALTNHAKATLVNAKHLLGSARQLELIPEDKSPNAIREIWPSPMMARIDTLANEKPENTVIIASGDPQCWGISEHFSKRLKSDEFESLPSLSILSRVANIMNWPVATTASLSLCSQPFESINLYLNPKSNLILLSSGSDTPEKVGQYLTNNGFGSSDITVLENLGSCSEAIKSATAKNITTIGPFSALNSLAIALKADETCTPLTCQPGLPDDSFEHDGQMTKQNMRAITLTHLRPLPGELLWDIGSGSGSIGIEWLRAASLLNGAQ